LDWAKGLSTSAYLIGCLLIVVLVGALYFGPGLLARWSATPVPFVYNQTELDARNRITNAGLQVGEVKRYPSGNVPKGHAIGTEPDFSATVKKGTVIDLLVSNGVTRVKVPNLRGMTYEQARKAIRVAGLSPGQHTFVNSPMRPGAVVNTTPRSGATVSAGAEVSFRLSLGPKGNG
jgi:serine/threonine-protein kinase